MHHRNTPHQPNHQKFAGFTLLELLITISVAVVLLTIAVPALQSTIQSTRMRSYSHNLFAQMQLARATAIATKTDAVICPSSDLQTCEDAPQWQVGWILYSDQNGDGEFDEGETPYRQQEGMEKIQVSASSNRTRIRFQPTGTAGGSNGTWTFCDPTLSTQPLAIILSRTGRARFSATASDGGALVCPS